jgi:hypothetical protein
LGFVARVPKYSPSVCRRIVATTALISYLFSAIGVPVPLPATPTKSGPAFFCQNRPCGCTSASDCWDHCCCSTPEERLAWSRANGVEPPAGFVVKAGGWNQARKRDCERDQADPGSNDCCCGKKASRCCDKDSTRSSDRLTWVAGITARKCRGDDSVWLTTGVAPVPVSATIWQPNWLCLGVLCSVDDQISLLPSSPAEPPPRRACSDSVAV